MITIIKKKDIALSRAEAVVNASNGWGYMGGQRCIDNHYPGVAESIQYASHGEVEKLSREFCKGNFWGIKPGIVFVTDAPNMNTNIIIHAVTMRTPGSKAKIKTIKILVPKIISIAQTMELKQIAIPLLGTGTGGLSRLDVLNIYDDYMKYNSIEFLIYTDYKREEN